MANAIEFKNVAKRFGEVRAVDDISLSIAKGEVVALLGPSGCGKTTILRCIAGFERPDSGSILIGGADVTRQPPYERNVGLLFQHYALFPHMTVTENVAYGLRYRGAAKSEIPQRVAEMLALVRLPGLGDRRPHQLSGGQQQRVALARALATRPELVLLDEPLSALDAKLRQELREELKELLGVVGSTAIVVTHDQEEAMSLGERVFVMNRGKIVQSGPPGDVYRRPGSRFVADFMGRANWVHGTVQVDAGGATRFVSDDGSSLTPDPSSPTSAGEGDLCVRPESIDIVPAGSEITAGHNRIEGVVIDSALLGASRHIVVGARNGAKLSVLQQNRHETQFGPGTAVVLGFPPSACVVIPKMKLGADL